MVFVIIVAAKDNQLIFGNVGRSRNQPFHVVCFAPMGNVGAGHFGKAVNGGLHGNPLFGEEIDAVISDDKSFAVKIGGL